MRRLLGFVLILCVSLVVQGHAATRLAPFTLAPPAAPQPQAAPPGGGRLYDDDLSFDKRWAQAFFHFPGVTNFLLTALMDDAYVPGESDRLAQAKAASEAAGGPIRPSDSEIVMTTSAKDIVRDPVCGCAVDGKGRLTDPTHCPAMSGVADEEQGRISSFSIMDPAALAAPLACYRRGRCQIDGVEFGGTTCCAQNSRDFNSALHDPHFYLIAPRPLAVAVDGLVPGVAAPGSPEICGFAIDRQRGVFSIPQAFDGFLSRAWLYASQHYGSHPPAPPAALAGISSRSPASRFEVARERLIRFMYKTPMSTLDGALRSTPVSPGFKSIGIEN